MLQGTAESTRLSARIISGIVVVALVATSVVFTSPQAHANFGSESTEQIIGVGRIQSSTAAPADTTAAAHFETPVLFSEEATELTSQLAQPVDRSMDNAAAAVESINLIQRFGEQDAEGWYTTKTSAYGPSSAGTHTALGTELTLTSMDIGCHIAHMDILIGRYVELNYNGIILRCRVVDTGTMANDGRLFDLQPGVCTYFGAETPEFGWGIRTVKWRFAD